MKGNAMRKIGINAELGFGIEIPEMMAHIKNAGFDAVFVSWHTDSPLAAWKAESLALGLEMPFIHAPFSKIEYLWEDDALGDEVLKVQMACVEDSAKNDIPIVVCHVYKGFGKEEKPTEIGLTRIKKLLDFAWEKGVRIAFENTEGEAYLDAVLTTFWDHPATGFCIDSGHELCYNYGHDLISKYGKKLIATHIDDNLGITGETIFWHDDLHVLPWDGKVDFDSFVKRVKATEFSDTLMFELTVKSKPNHTENDCYREMGCDAYLKEAYARACRLAKMFD